MRFQVDPDNVRKASAESGVSKPSGGGGGGASHDTPNKPPPLETRIIEGAKLTPPQWIQCDLRNLKLPVLGKFTVVMADPPWDIHMELPYGTMSDEEMRRLPVPTLQVL